MQCHNCDARCDREDGYEYNGLDKKLIPSATYVCPECHSVFYWRLGDRLRADDDNPQPLPHECYP